jgi:hypothetical protein
MSEMTWPERAKGFYQLFTVERADGLQGASREIPATLRAVMRDVPDRAEELRVTLIQLLDRENDLIERKHQTREAFSSYHGDLINAVAALGDKRALGPLLDVMETGSMASHGIARLGATAVLDQLLILAEVPSLTTRNAATRTLGFLLDPLTNPHPVGASQKVEIKMALLKRLSDVSPFVRISGIQAVSRVPGTDVTEALLSLAASDPNVRTTESGEMEYPVRAAAHRALVIRSQEGVR